VNPQQLLLQADLGKYICITHDQKYRHNPRKYRITPSPWRGTKSENFMNNGHRKTAILRIFSGIRMYGGILCQNMFF